MSRIGRLPVPSIRRATSTRDARRRRSGAGAQGEPRAAPARAGSRRRSSDGKLVVKRSDDSKAQRALHGLSRALLANAVAGVTQGFTQGARDPRRRLPRAGRAARAVVSASASPIRSTSRCREGIQIAVDKQTRSDRRRDRSPGSRPGGGGDPVAASARRVQGQGHPVRRRESFARRPARPARSKARPRGSHGSAASTDSADPATDPPPDPEAARRHGRPAAARGVPERQAHLRPGHRRRAGPDGRRGVDPRRGASRSKAKRRRERRGGEGRRRGHRRAAEGEGDRGRWSSTAAGSAYHGRIKALADAAARPRD